MTDHIFDELPSLLTGQSNRDELDTAAAHLRTCTDCQQELINALVAHSSLSSAARYTPGVLPAVLTRQSHIAALADTFEPTLHAVSDDENVSSDSPRESELTSDRMPDLSSLFATVRDEAAQAAVAASVAPTGNDSVAITNRRSSRSGGHGWSARWLVAAAVVGLGLGSAGVLATRNSNNHVSASTTVALAAYDKGSTPATAKVLNGDDMTLDATGLPSPTAGALYEVWLTNATRTKMHALGWIDTNGKGEFTVPKELMGEYSAIEVSIQQVSSPNYYYSGTSVLRGSY